MKVIVDANIVFSALLTSQGKIADILTNPLSVELIAPEFLRQEIDKHKLKISRLTGLNSKEIQEMEYLITQHIQFFSESIIKPSIWPVAEKITEKVDLNDTPYVAFSKHFKCKIWTGDKKLIHGLTKKGFANFITTDEILIFRDKKRK
jgi:predicted nucleic acid-binding protein